MAKIQTEKLPSVGNTEAISREIILELVSYYFERNAKTDLVKYYGPFLET